MKGERGTKKRRSLGDRESGVKVQEAREGQGIGRERERERKSER